MKKFYCGAVVRDCDATFMADTDEEILSEVAIHAREVHGMQQIPGELIAQVRQNIREHA